MSKLHFKEDHFLKAILFIFTSVFTARVMQIHILGIEAVRIGFGSLFIMLGGMFLGPLYGAFIGIVADVIGFFFFQPGYRIQDYLPQITIVSALWGVLPWYLFRWRKFSIQIKDLFLILGIPQVLFNIGSMSFIIHSSFGIPLMVLIRNRSIAQIATIPIYVAIVLYSLKIKNKVKVNLNVVKHSLRPHNN